MMQSILLAGGAGGGLSVIGTLSGLGLTSGLEVCIDAGDFQSYVGSGEPWLDRTPNNFFFFLGSGSAGTLANPAFSGPAGYAPAYFGITAAGQRFTYHGANEAVFETFHRNNASFTAMMLYYHTGAGGQLLSDNDNTLGQNGIAIRQGGGTLQLIVASTATAASAALSVTLTASPTSGRWHFMAVSVSEAQGVSGGFFYLDGGYASSAANANPFDATYINPGAGNAAQIMEISDGGGSSLDAGYRISTLALWSRALTKANLDAIWEQLRTRFGI